MASLDDILTSVKNISTALSANTSALNRGQGTVTSLTVTADTLIVTGMGRLVTATVIVAGSGAGLIHNAATVALATAANALVVTPMTVGVQQCGHAFTNGLVIKVGTGQSINVSYYTGY